MEKFSRYTDSRGRLWVVLRRLAEVDIKDGKVSTRPTTVELLDVHGEKSIELSHADFEKYVSEGMMKQIPK